MQRTKARNSGAAAEQQGAAHGAVCEAQNATITSQGELRENAVVDTGSENEAAHP